MRKTDEDTKCMVASVAIVSIPFLLLFMYSFVRSNWSGAFAIFFAWLIIGGFVSCSISNVAEKILSRTDKKSETSEWAKAFAISFSLIIACIVILTILAFVLGLLSDFAEFLKNKYGL